LTQKVVLPTTTGKEPRFFYGYIIVLAGFFVMVLMNGAFYSFGVFFKPMLEEFGWTRAMTSGAYSLNMILWGLLSIITGRLNDRFGPRIVITACGFIFGAGYLLMSRISTLWQFYLFYGVIIAIGLSGCFAPIRWFTKRRGLMTGIVISGIGVGTIIIPPLASQLISIYGWRTSYIFLGITTLVLLIISAQFLRRDPGQIGQMPYGEDKLKPKGSVSETGGFSFQEAIHTRRFWMLSAVFFCYGFIVHTIMVHIVSHATDLGIAPVIASGILAAMGGISITGRIGMGSVADRIGNKRSLLINFFLLAISLLWLLRVRDLGMFYLFAVVFGFSWGGLAIFNSLMTAEVFGLKAHGAIMGLVTFVYTTGSAIGPVLAGHIFDITGSYNSAFMVTAALGVAGFIAASLLPTAIRSRLSVK
jgi:MFS family permease